MIEQKHDNNNYTAEDIERYHSGKMTAQEMHMLEKAALDDPFLADALEGYTQTKTPIADIQFVRGELASRITTTKVVAFSKEKTSQQFLRIAALFVLVAGLGWAVYQFSFKGNNEIAVTTAPVYEEKTTDTTNASVTSAAPSDSTPQLKERQTDNKSVSAPKARSVPKAENSYNEQLTTQNNRPGYAPANNNNGFVNNKMLAKKVPAEQENSEAASSNPFNADSPSASVVTMTPDARMTKDNVIVLQRAKDSTMQEIVLGSSKKDSNYRKAKTQFEEAEPQDGQRFYDEYITQNLKVPEIEKFKQSSREVKLSFDVNDAGQAVNIQVEKSMCDECDKEAIRLLKEGPKLVKKTKSKRKGKISIRF